MAHIDTIPLDCGATLVTELIDSAASAAVSWLLPVGSAGDPGDADGLASILGEMIFRGAGELDSRALSDALDRLGADRNSQVLVHHLRLSSTLVGDRLFDTLPLLTDIVRRPRLPDSALDAVRSLCLQSLDGLDDDPQQLVMLRLREHHFPPPFNRHGYGQRGVIESASIEHLRDAWRSRCVPHGSIISIAGRVDPPAVAARLNQLLDGWSGEAREPVELAPAARGHAHLKQDTAQMHIGLAWAAPREADPESMLERLGIAVLSGGTSARLFTEVRQKRSLCYSVGASYRAGRDHGAVTLYAGTTPERAQETLDVCAAEIERLRAGAEAEEFHRATVGLKSSLVMQGESTSARAAAIGQDLFRIGRARTLDELAAAVDAITIEDLNAYLAKREIGELTVSTIGPVKPERVSVAAG